MRPLPQIVQFVLLLAMCGLCGVQWWRESRLREKAVELRTELIKTTTDRDQLADRAKAADGEILFMGRVENPQPAAHP